MFIVCNHLCFLEYTFSYVSTLIITWSRSTKWASNTNNITVHYESESKCKYNFIYIYGWWILFNSCLFHIFGYSDSHFLTICIYKILSSSWTVAYSGFCTVGAEIKISILTSRGARFYHAKCGIVFSRALFRPPINIIRINTLGKTHIFINL